MFKPMTSQGATREGILTTAKVATAKEHVEELLWGDLFSEPVHAMHSTAESLGAHGGSTIVVDSTALAVLWSMLIKNGTLLGIAQYCECLRHD